MWLKALQRYWYQQGYQRFMRERAVLSSMIQNNLAKSSSEKFFSKLFLDSLQLAWVSIMVDLYPTMTKSCYFQCKHNISVIRKQVIIFKVNFLLTVGSLILRNCFLQIALKLLNTLLYLWTVLRSECPWTKGARVLKWWNIILWQTVVCDYCI